MTFEAVDAVAVAGTLTLVNNWTLKLGSGFKNGGSTVLFSYGTLGASPDLVPTSMSPTSASRRRGRCRSPTRAARSSSTASGFRRPA
jgi:hypothetical protein